MSWFKKQQTEPTFGGFWNRIIGRSDEEPVIKSEKNGQVTDKYICIVKYAQTDNSARDPCILRLPRYLDEKLDLSRYPQIEKIGANIPLPISIPPLFGLSPSHATLALLGLSLTNILIFTILFISWIRKRINRGKSSSKKTRYSISGSRSFNKGHAGTSQTPTSLGQIFSQKKMLENSPIMQNEDSSGNSSPINLTSSEDLSHLSSDDSLDSGDERVKLVLIIRTDLPMTKGKAAAQCCHACLEAYKNSSHTVLKKWYDQGQPKITLKCPSGDELLNLYGKAKNSGLPAQIICDAGRTQIERGSYTVLALGPETQDRIDKVSGYLKLY